jgi:hypothetical protein
MLRPINKSRRNESATCKVRATPLVVNGLLLAMLSMAQRAPALKHFGSGCAVLKLGDTYHLFVVMFQGVTD